MTTRKFQPAEVLSQTVNGAIVLVGVMLLSLPLVLLGFALIVVERWLFRQLEPRRKK